MTQIRWHNRIRKRHIKRATAFLRLFLNKKDLNKLKAKLKKHRITTDYHTAKDIIRASQSQMVADDNANLLEHINDVKNGLAFYPVILVRAKKRLFIADGFHRICTAYSIDDKTKIASVDIIL
jgi:hypothetical protein